MSGAACKTIINDATNGAVAEFQRAVNIFHRAAEQLDVNAPEFDEAIEIDGKLEKALDKARRDYRALALRIAKGLAGRID